jgi:hypothetical protein
MEVQKWNKKQNKEKNMTEDKRTEGEKAFPFR